MSILEFWFSNKDLWFYATPTDDEAIKRQFHHLLAFDLPENTPDEVLSKIILYDQMTRHFYRNEPEVWKKYLPLACDLSKYALMQGFDKFYSPEQNNFSLMPLRHSDSLDNVKIAFDKIKEYMNHTEDPIYDKFYYHTLKKYGKLENIRQYNMDRTETNNVYDWILYYSIIDRRFKPWFANYKSMYDFDHITQSDIFNNIYQMVTRNNMTSVCVSLSGGVDSMIVLSCLLILRNRDILDSVMGFHINYGNRYKSWLEREFVIRFCNKHNVPLVIRDIEEIKRNRKSREVYEDITRHIRYDMYKLINLPVFFGHNRDDCLENMVTNIKKNQHLNNLYGMNEISNIDSVIVYRPLLTFSKNDIVSLATMMKLHHTRNSTPKWCDRWNIRNVFLEFVEKQQPGFTNGLMNITSMLNESYTLINSIVHSQMNNITITETDSKITFNIPNYDGSFKKEVWNSIIVNLCKNNNISVPSHKSIVNFLSRINTCTPRVNLGKNIYAIYGQNSTDICYIKSDIPVVRRR